MLELVFWDEYSNEIISIDFDWLDEAKEYVRKCGDFLAFLGATKWDVFLHEPLGDGPDVLLCGTL